MKTLVKIILGGALSWLSMSIGFYFSANIILKDIGLDAISYYSCAITTTIAFGVGFLVSIAKLLAEDK